MANLANLRLVAPEEDDDDLYGGYEYDPTLDAEVRKRLRGSQRNPLTVNVARAARNLRAWCVCLVLPDAGTR